MLLSLLGLILFMVGKTNFLNEKQTLSNRRIRLDFVKCVK